jgi:hypothetical protein
MYESFVVILCILACLNSTFQSVTAFKQHDDPHVDELMELLFPNRTHTASGKIGDREELHLRKLQISKPPYDPKGDYTCTSNVERQT